MLTRQETPVVRVAAVLSALCLTLDLATPLPGQSAQSTPSGSGGSFLYYYSTPSATLDHEAHSVPATDQARFDHLKALFSNEGCFGDRLKIQPLAKERSSPGSIICSLQGTTTATVVVLAEYQHQGKGQSAVENWSGAALLPRLYLAMQARPRQNTWVFVESGGKSGASSYLHPLTGEQKKQIKAMVALESLGTSPALHFYSITDDMFLQAATAHLQMALALAMLSDRRVPPPQALDPSPWLRTDDTQPFRYSHVPCILIDSITEKQAGIPGSARDTASAINSQAYFINYSGIAVFLVALDQLAAKLPADDRIWHGEGGQFHLDLNDLPIN